MWTPRRILLLLTGFLVFAGVYFVYARALGWLDGLPQLPAAKLIPGDGTFLPPVRMVSPTIQRLREAFGPNCPEENSQNYPTQLEFRNGDSSVVLASGSPPFNTGSNRLTLTPFSIAVFGKPKPPHQRLPGEVGEISTFHADKAVLEFDKPITGLNDLGSGKVKLVRLELVSDPENVPPDPRRGMVYVTNNQRAADPNRFLVVRTPGPVFYRDPKAVPNATGPDVWTDAAVEITDRQNLPRGYAPSSPPTAPAKGEDLRDASAVAGILAGERYPPPTVSAVGMRVYFEAEKPAPPPGSPAALAAAAPKKGSAGFSGVRRLELLERVLINLWVDSSQSLMSEPAKPTDKDKDKKPAEKKAGPTGPAVEPPAALGAVAGGAFHGARVAKQLDKALLQVETLGAFAYDVEKNTARFDVLPEANPVLRNDVQVTRIPATGGTHQLLSQVLEIEFNGPPTGPQPQPQTPATPAPNRPPEPAAGPTFKRLHAWTYTPGRILTVIAEKEQLEAYGHDLVHEQAENRTILYGAPLNAVRGPNLLTAGAANQSASLVLAPGPDGSTAATVHGRGQIELYDAATKDKSITARWAKALTHTKETVAGRPLDLLTFTGAAEFRDEKADYTLRGDVLKLWIGPNQPGDPKTVQAATVDPKGDTPAATGQPLPHRLQALGNVSSQSADFTIERAEHLNVLFQDVPPPPEPKVEPKATAPMPQPPAAAPTGPAVPSVAPPAEAERPKEPAKPKPPLKLRARVIDTYVNRYPVKPDPKAEKKPDPKGGPAKGPAEAALKYDLRQARCDGAVEAHQDPDGPDKLRGLDLSATALLIDHTPDGSVMTVVGTEEKPGEVHFEGTSILGPKVVIDQIHNSTLVTGRGALQMQSGSDFNGGPLKNPEVIVVNWRDEMEFQGARRTARFVGKVNARQGESWVLCHTMQVTFDRPVYFKQLRRPGDAPEAKAPAAPPKGKDGQKDAAAKEDANPKLETVSCWPAPEDAREEMKDVWFHEVGRDESRKVVKTQQVVARELKLTARAVDERGDTCQLVTADGPGTVRIWQPGEKDPATPPPQKGPTGQPAPPKKDGKQPAETEMKLTVVSFVGRMVARDKGKLYQEADFRDAVEVVNLPADDPNAKVELFRLPARSTTLKCSDRLLLATYRKADGPAEQTMDARGNVFIRSDEYEGSGEVVQYEGQRVTFYGADPGKPGPIRGKARIVTRFKENGQDGDRITYNRATGLVDTVGSTGASIQPPSKR